VLGTNPELEILLPVHNEAGSIEATIREIYSELLPQVSLRFVICEDGSRDNTKEILQRLAETLPIKLILSEERKGYSRTVTDGMKALQAPYLLCLDSDGQCDPREAAPAAYVIFMVTNNEWRKALKFVGSFAGLAAAFFFVCQLWTRGWFAFHTIGASTVHPCSMKLWLDGTLDELNYILVPFVLTVVICFRRRSSKDISLPFIYLILASLSTILRGKLGSDFNYYLKWEAALCLCLGFEYGGAARIECS
jgi:glycosyltransferase involved in cell wall biosynthesis